MLWFNEEKHVGVIEANDGRRFSVERTAFVDKAPVGRCAGLLVAFTIDGDAATEVTLVPDLPQRRARFRGSRRSF